MVRAQAEVITPSVPLSSLKAAEAESSTSSFFPAAPTLAVKPATTCKPDQIASCEGMEGNKDDLLARSATGWLAVLAVLAMGWHCMRTADLGDVRARDVLRQV